MRMRGICIFGGATISILLTARCLVGQTQVFENIYQDTRWTPAGNPYIVAREILVIGDDQDPPVLTIEPGVDVQFAPGACLRIGRWDEIWRTAEPGIIQAEGTVDAPIRFRPIGGEWNGIRIEGSWHDNRLIHCVIDAATGGVQSWLLRVDHGKLKMRDSKVINNLGGEGVLTNFGDVELVNVLIASNGSGLNLTSTRAEKILNCTIVNNTRSGFYLGMYSTLEQPITNTIIWGNGKPNYSYMSPADFDHSDIEEPSLAGQNGSICGDPRLDADFRPLPSSWCLDSGKFEGAPSDDIRGFGRPCGRGVDMGVYEAGDCAPPSRYIRGDANVDGVADISDGITILTFLFAGNEKVTCRDAIDADDSGVLDVTDAVYLLVHLFQGGPAPPAPFPGCGIDPTLDALDCESFAGCQ
jgi:hypothetical protein